MSKEDFKSTAWDKEICDQFSWRGLLCKKFNLVNLNFSCGGSSNQKQFRLAMEFFGSKQYQIVRNEFDRIIVVWGLTSTARNELWATSLHDHYNFFYGDDEDVFSRFMIENSYDHDAEVADLRNRMLYWNVFFKSQNIDNVWFDTFNSHNYNHDFFNCKKEKTFETQPISQRATWVDQTYYDDVKVSDWPSYENFCIGDFAGVKTDTMQAIKQIFGIKPRANVLPTYLKHHDELDRLDPVMNLLDHDRFPRDLMSWLMTQTGCDLSRNDQLYHHSNWSIDRQGMLKLTHAGLLNPYSYHPTKKGHTLLVDYFSQKLQKILDHGRESLHG